MKELLSKSAQILNANIALVLFVGILNIQILSGVMAYISLLGIVMSFVLEIVVYGRIVTRIRGNPAIPAFEILKANWLNYVVVLILLSLPIFLYAQLSKLFPVPMELSIYGNEGVKALVNALAIYVLPIVFIKGQHLRAVMAGVLFFFKNIKKSAPIIFLVICIFFLKASAVTWFIQQARPASDLIFLLPLMAFVNVAATYLSFLVFTVASVVLMAKSLEEASDGA